MLIVSQDKIRIIDITGKDIEINNPETWNQGFWSIDTYPNCNDSQKYHLRLGIYKTEERAKEILIEIAREFKRVLRTQSRETGQITFYDVPKVYYMPKE